MPADSKADYRRKKQFFNQMLTVYGRQATLEALQDAQLTCYRLHLADSNKPAPVLQRLLKLAADRGVEVCFHGKRELSRISRNGKQDQGVAADILCPGFRSVEDYLATAPEPGERLLAVDSVTNPQNAGMLVRSAVAGGISGIIWPDTGNAALGPLAIKASAGTLYRAPLLRCDKLGPALRQFHDRGFRIYTLEANAPASLFDQRDASNTVYVLGNESKGVSEDARAQADGSLSIPMHNSVESLNVAVTAALIAYLDK